MRLYLAGPYTRRAEIDAHAATLRQHGFTVLSTWHSTNQGALDAHILEDAQTVVAAQVAGINLHEIVRCDTLLLFSTPGEPARGGAHFETGVAWTLHKGVAVIGGAAILFHRLPGVTLAPTLDDWLTAQATRRTL